MTTLTRIALAQWGELLGTRGLGVQVRWRIVEALAVGPVEVDFGGVNLASQSFLDEAFGRMSEDFEASFLNAHCQIVNANDTILTMLRVAIRERRRLQGLGGAPQAMAFR